MILGFNKKAKYLQAIKAKTKKIGNTALKKKVDIVNIANNKKFRSEGTCNSL